MLAGSAVSSFFRNVISCERCRFSFGSKRLQTRLCARMFESCVADVCVCVPFWSMNAGGHSHQGLGFRYYDKQGAGALPGGLLPMKTPSGRGENVPASNY